MLFRMLLYLTQRHALEYRLSKMHFTCPEEQSESFFSENQNPTTCRNLSKNFNKLSGNFLVRLLILPSKRPEDYFGYLFCKRFHNFFRLWTKNFQHSCQYCILKVGMKTMKRKDFWKKFFSKKAFSAIQQTIFSAEITKCFFYPEQSAVEKLKTNYNFLRNLG